MELKTLGQLRALLVQMETSLGLLDLSQNEKDVFYAISSIGDPMAVAVRSEAIRQHPLVINMPPASFHRALRGLIDRGLIGHAPQTRAGQYIILREIGA